ncbi:hypothetical protein BDD26_3647 [Xenorhabdus cabanillasii]|uniref:Uncharacterized protein n=1 Tax=Xenorhabdus cabanillasii TaxID=351673 RepID=A0A3D9URU3_9GAMM|nr:hypothetical protein [Xenorhabdus cabanillasii]REF28694.1 hypothetical protein BDD26_3647 [Xenorhabdus cabanillasii]
MKSANCKKCQGEMAQNDQTCPHCGAKRSRGLKPETIIVTTVGVLACAAAFHIVSSAGLFNDSEQTFYTGESQLSFKKMHDMVTSPFYNCLTEKYSGKLGQLKLDEILACDDDFRKDSNTSHRLINLDNFVSNFSRENNAYRPLETAIKGNMFDVSSYQHIETTYRLALNQQQPYAIVQTVFKGKSIFESLVEDTYAVKVDIKTGEIIATIPKATVTDIGVVVAETRLE